MKVAAFLVVLAGSIQAEEKKRYRAPKGFDENGYKINGQHPKRRLQALNKFMCNWAESYMEDGKSSKFCKRYTNMIYRLNDSFGREQCRFFDPSVKFGGPNPDESMEGMVAAKNPNAKNPTKARRLRRNANDTTDDACGEGVDEDTCNEESMEGMECDQDDLNDPDMAAFCDEKEARKISTPNRKLKRYSTGLAKWCNRYIKECYGQRKHQHCVNRAKKFLNTLAIED